MFQTRFATLARTLRAIGPVAMLSTAALLPAGTANAHQRDFPFTYDWHQSSAGEEELELQSTFDQSGNGLNESLEFEYGVNRKFMVAPYLMYSKEDGSPFAYRGFKVETRYQLGEFKPNTLLAGLYAEYEKPKDDTYELEGKIILSVYDKRGGDFSVNLITEKQEKSGATRRYAVSGGYAMPVGNGLSRAGVECIKDIDTGRVNLGPTYAFGLGKGAWITAGVALPVNNRSDNKAVFRLLGEYEW